jgi:hypothetical protein
MPNAPMKLNSAFLALQMAKNDYTKVSGQLPTPSHINELKSITLTYLNIIYQLDRSVTTSKQFYWLSTIKTAWQKHIFTPFQFVDEVYIGEYTQSTGVVYSLDELSKVFQAEFINYPNVYYPSTKKEVYKRLVWYGMRLQRKGLFNIEIMNATALRMNEALKDKLSYRETLKKSLGAYLYVFENISKPLHINEVKERLRDGGKHRGLQKKDEHAQNVERVKACLSLHVKANKKPNITELAKVLHLSRKTVHGIVKSLLVLCFFGFILLEVLKSSTIIPIAKVTLFQTAHQYDGLEALKKSDFIRSSTLSYTDS